MQLSGNLTLNRFEWATTEARKILTIQPGAVYYDIGAGENTLVQSIGHHKSLTRSFDLVPRNDNVEQWDIEQAFPFDYVQADIITFLEIVEHLNNPWLCIKNIAAIAKPGCHLILTTPNPGWSTGRVNLLFKGYLTCFTRSDLELNHHVFTAWPHILEKLLADNGFEIINYVTLDGGTQVFDKNMKIATSLLQIPARVIKKAIEAKDPSSMGMSYGVIARKIA